MQKECKVCGQTFKSERGLHLHLSKKHKISVKDYYKKFYPRFSKLSNKKIPFKSLSDYMSRDFINRSELISWCHSAEKSEVKDYIYSLMKTRIDKKGLKCLPSHIELYLCDMPTIDIYKESFGSYSKLSEQMDVSLIFNKPMPKDFFEKEEDESMKIFVDTREQKPISFKNQESMKLDFGDYTAAGDFYDYTYIDRKSEGDFKSTLSGENFERFKRELQRARDFNSYIFIVVESNIEKIKKNNLFGPHKSKLPYIWHNLKSASHEYGDVCQFIFAQNRKGLQKIIPKILSYGKRLWNVDMQYFIDKKINE